MNAIAIWADTKGAGKCRGCDAALTWAVLVKSGKRMCFTGTPAVLRTEKDVAGRTIEYVSFDENHWATCPKAKDFRTRKEPRHE